MKKYDFAGYQGILKFTMNNGRAVTTKYYKNSGTKALGSLITNCLVGNTLPRTAYPMYIDVVINKRSCLNSKRGISSPYVVEPTDEQVENERLIGSAKYNALIRSVDVGQLPVSGEGVIQLLDGSENQQVLAEIKAPDILGVLETIRSDPNYNATLEWTLQIYNM